MSNDTSERRARRRLRGKENLLNTVFASSIVLIAMLLGFGTAGMTYGKWTQNGLLVDAGVVMFLIGLAGLGALIGMVIRQ